MHPGSLERATGIYGGVFTSHSRSFNDKENRCRRVFAWTVQEYGGVWHLCTPGSGQPVIFKCKEDYVYAMTLVAMCAYDCPDVQVITFELMSNHVHFILCGEKSKVLAFFGLFRKRLARYLWSNGKRVSLDGFVCEDPIGVDNLESLRNQIVYTNRNNFVVDPEQTPFSYPYGANGYFFLPAVKTKRDRCFGDMTDREKRAFLHSKHLDYPKEYVIVDNYFSPMNYCRLDIGEGIFRDARHYFHKLGKNIESYQEIASLLGDSLYYTDDELNDAVFRICRERFNGQRLTSLGKEERMELARALHYDYNADNAKIARLMGLPKPLLDELFPMRR